ncbi:MAG: amidase family protein, partial [Firmicutes bacterium]|nr:amidase family protein [Bacillota bacterium]
VVWRSQLTRLTNPFNLAGVPALSVPIGLSPSGLPLAVQLVGPNFCEALLLDVASALAERLPPMVWAG